MSNLEEFGNKQIEAFTVHRKLYAQQHRPPKRRTTSWGDVLVYSTLLLLTIASITVSGFHTIPTFLSTIGGSSLDEIKAIATFTMLELGILIVSYIRMHDAFHKKTRQTMNVSRRGAAISILLLLIAVGVNLRDVLVNEEIFIHKIANIGIFALVGIAAPLVAWQASELLAFYTVRSEIEHRGRLDEWENSLLRSFNANKRKYIQPIVQKNETRQKPARLEAERYFTEHAERLTDNSSMDTIAAEAEELGYSVGRGTLYKVWRELNG